MVQFASDAFTGTENTVLSTYNADWVLHGSATGNAQIASDRARQSTNAQTVIYFHTGSPASADYSVSADCFAKETDGGASAVGVLGRVDTAANTYYAARYIGSATDGWQLTKFVAGVATQLGSTFAQSLTDETAYRVMLEMIGSTIKLYVDGVERISATDSAITAAGKAGIRFGNGSSASDTTGIHLDNFSADDIGGGVTVQPGTGFILSSAISPTTVVSHLIAVDAGSAVMTGEIPTLSVSGGESIAVDAGSLVISGSAPITAITDNHTAVPDTGSFTVTGLAPISAATDNHAIPVDVGVLTITGLVPASAISDNRVIVIAAGVLSISGAAPVVSVSDNKVIAIGSGTLTMTGFAPDIIVPIVITVDAGSAVFSGQTPTMLVASTLFTVTLNVWSAAAESTTWKVDGE